MSSGLPHFTSCADVLARVYEFIDHELADADCAHIQEHLDECALARLIASSADAFVAERDHPSVTVPMQAVAVELYVTYSMGRQHWTDQLPDAGRHHDQTDSARLGGPYELRESRP